MRSSNGQIVTRGPDAAYNCVRLRLVMLIRSLVALLPAVLVAACSSAAPIPQPLVVAAAASLAPIFDQLGELYTDQTGEEVIFSYGATGSLAAQIENGAPFDVFASADARRIDELIEADLLDGDSRLEFAQGVLVLVAAPQSSFALQSIDDLADPAVRDVAIANPTHAPYGAAAGQALLSSGIELEVGPKIVFGENVRQAGILVQTGNTDAALIPLSIAMNLNLQGLELSQDLYEPILHVAAVHSEAANQDSAIAFMAFLSSPDAIEVIESAGLLSPGG